MKIAAGFGWESPFMFTAAVDNMLAMETPDNCELKWFRGEGWCSARQHTDICEKALDWNADYICFVGSDQLHPPDMFGTLLENVSATTAVAALVPTRGQIFQEGMKKFQPLAFTGRCRI